MTLIYAFETLLSAAVYRLWKFDRCRRMVMGPFFILGMKKYCILLLSDSGFHGFTLDCCLGNPFRKGNRGPFIPSIWVRDIKHPYMFGISFLGCVFFKPFHFMTAYIADGTAILADNSSVCCVHFSRAVLKYNTTLAFHSTFSKGPPRVQSSPHLFCPSHSSLVSSSILSSNVHLSLSILLCLRSSDRHATGTL